MTLLSFLLLRRILSFVWIIHVLLLLLLPLDSVSSEDIYTTYQSKQMQRKKIAIIGGGISGTFVTKYLIDYDVNCTTLDTITIFDAAHNDDDDDMMNKAFRKNTTLHTQNHHQGSRIASYEMEVNIDDINTTSSTGSNTSSSGSRLSKFLWRD